MRLGVMGGTFDPIHIGHLVTAEEALYQFELDEVLFVPSARPPHKTDSRQSDARHRLRMVELSIEADPSLSVSAMELEREGLSYTIDTLRQIHAERGKGTDLYFITGADAILEILTWKDPEELLAESRFIAATRPGYPLEKLAEALPDSNSAGEAALRSVSAMEIPALAISSTDIRRRASEGRPFRYLVCDAVWSYIRENGLYR